jgi:hypothetical protein
MTRVMVALGITLIVVNATIARVKITFPAQRYKLHQLIRANVANTGNTAVSFCVEFGQTSMKDGEVESTPSPFQVQRNNNGRWGTLIIGPDIGSARGAVVLQPGESKEFPFRLNDSGKLRLRLDYWRGSLPTLDCRELKGSKSLTSSIFTID